MPRQQIVGGAPCGREVVAHQVDGDQIDARREKIRIERDRRAERRDRRIELTEMRLRQAEVVARRRALRLLRIERENAAELGRRAFPITLQFFAKSELDALANLTLPRDVEQRRRVGRTR